MGNPLVEFKDWSIGKLVALASKVGDPATCEAVLRDERRITADDASRVDQNLVTATTPSWGAEWERFYWEIFARKVSFVGVKIPAEQLGFGWSVIVAKGLNCNQVWRKCSQEFDTYSVAGESIFGRDYCMNNRRPMHKAYAKRFRNRVEADEEMKNLSRTQFAEGKTRSITLLERLLLELWYFWKTNGKHLDRNSSTLCAGSLTSDYTAPMVGWTERNTLMVNHCTVGYASAHQEVRIRVAL